MLTSQQVKWVKVLMVIFLLAGGGYLGLNYQAYLQAKKTDYHWTSAEDGMTLVYRPSKNDAYVEIHDYFLPGPKKWKPDFTLPKPGSWNSWFVDRYIKIPDPDSLFVRARVEELGSRLSGLVRVAIADPQDRLSPMAMDAIIRMGRGGDSEATTVLETMIKAKDAPRARLLAIKGLARVNNINCSTDEEYENWFQKVILPRAVQLKEGS